MAVAARLFAGHFRFGKKLAATSILSSSHKFLPYLRPLVSPLVPVVIAIPLIFSGHALVPGLLILGTAVELLFARGRIRANRDRVVVYEKGFECCGEFLGYDKADECFIVENSLHNKKTSAN